MSTLAAITISIFLLPVQLKLTERTLSCLQIHDCLKNKLIIEGGLQLQLVECLHNNEERDFFSTADRNPDRS